jgi:hypothetical protein
MRLRHRRYRHGIITSGTIEIMSLPIGTPMTSTGELPTEAHTARVWTMNLRICERAAPRYLRTQVARRSQQ